jgi:hypothetical protein
MIYCTAVKHVLVQCVNVHTYELKLNLREKLLLDKALAALYGGSHTIINKQK